MRNLVISLIVCTLCAFGQPLVQAGERLSPERLWGLARLGSACVHPDGTAVAYAVRRYSLPDNQGTSEIHLLDLATRQSRVLIGNLQAADSLTFGRSGEELRLFYVGLPRGDEFQDTEPQVWSVDLAGQGPRQVTSVAAGVGHLKVSPTGTHIAFTSAVTMDPTVTQQYPDLPHADARIIDALLYRHWDSWHDHAYSHVHVAALQDDGRAGEPIDVMEGLHADCPLPPFGGDEQFNWSPDGKEIAFTAKVVNNPAESTDSDIYVARIDGSRPTVCVTPGMDGFDTDPVFSPDGAFLAFHSMQRPGFEADKNRLLLLDRASHTMRDLTAGIDQTSHGATWMPDSRSLVFASECHGCEQLFRVTLADGGVTQISRGWYDWSLRGVLPDGHTLLVDSQSMLRPRELALLNLQDTTSQVLTHLNDSSLAELELPQVAERWVTASDGQQIHCWVIYPPDFDPHKNQKWPLITYCQGGPQSQIGQWFSYRWNFHLMAAQGYVVVAPNRRGLPGFGRAWNDQISGDWGGQAMRDILAATDAMMVEPYIDTKRMAAVGASFGGYSVYWLMGHHQDRFCCMIAHAGVFNLESMYGATDEIWFSNWDLGGPYWQDAQVRRAYDRFSPHRFVANWRTPLLVIHGEKDFRIPVTQAMEAFTAAQLNGVPSRFLYFPSEGHWVLSPQNGVLWHRVFFDWLDRYCKP
ncbi:MAG: S9 family peptidase [Planctomycetaceae bacterium]|nr:S9 family peptidase [Planctomycetaceae bacterium]